MIIITILRRNIMTRYDAVIVGGGASGLMCAASLQMSGKIIKTALIEKNAVLGRKLAATGNGRCNLSNIACPNYKKTLTVFDSFGVLTRSENGWIYPYAQEARVVVDALTDRLTDVDIFLESTVEHIDKADTDSNASYGCNDGFVISYRQNGREMRIKTRFLILATGGKAAPQFGTSGDGYKLVKTLGHSVSRLYPILSPVECEESFLELKGARADGVVRLYSRGNNIFEERGRIQFTDFGLSGICVFNLTRHLKPNIKNGILDFSDYDIVLDLAPDIAYDDLNNILESPVNPLRSIVGSVLAKYIIQKYSSDMAFGVKALRFKPSGIRGWKAAQLTGGGVPLDEFDENMESKKVKGLYVLGEMLDYDGPCGGFNLDNAWQTALLASEDIIAKVG